MSKKLLLADDSFVIQKLVGLSFANEAIEIVSTDNGDDAYYQAAVALFEKQVEKYMLFGLDSWRISIR